MVAPNERVKLTWRGGRLKGNRSILIVVKRRLGAERVEGTIRQRGDTKELYFSDPNGIRIQVQDVRYRGGVGPLGARNP